MSAKKMVLKRISHSKINFKEKKVLVRADLDAPLRKRKGRIVVGDKRRLVKGLPTIKLLLKKGAKVVVMGHLDRPKGKKVKRLRMDPVAEELENLLGKKYRVVKLNDCLGKKVKKRIETMKKEEVILLENLRFYPEEKKNNQNFAKKLTQGFDYYVNDAFATSHREHASIAGAVKYLPSLMGLLLEKETQELEKMLKKPKRPFIAILGGIKVESKIKVIENLLKKADLILLGSAMSWPFLINKGIELKGVEVKGIEKAKKIMKKKNFKKIILPEDFRLKNKQIIRTDEESKEKLRYDIGPETIRDYKKRLEKAKMVFWNGPLGYFEKKPFDKGTSEIGRFLASLSKRKKTRVIIGGGDTEEALKKWLKDYDHVSTGGGASLKIVGGEKLTGVEALKKTRIKESNECSKKAS